MTISRRVFVKSGGLALFSLGSDPLFLARAAFEITVPTIAKASLEGQVESLKGVTENVIVGATVPIGTGMVELYMSVKDENEKSRKNN